MCLDDRSVFSYCWYVAFIELLLVCLCLCVCVCVCVFFEWNYVRTLCSGQRTTSSVKCGTRHNKTTTAGARENGNNCALF